MTAENTRESLSDGDLDAVRDKLLGWAATLSDREQQALVVLLTSLQAPDGADTAGFTQGSLTFGTMSSLKLMGEILSNVSKTRSEISMTFARNSRA